jgi:diguanylate cyclase
MRLIHDPSAPRSRPLRGFGGEAAARRGEADAGAGRQKRIVLLLIFALSWTASALAWTLMERRGVASPALRAVFGANIVFHPWMFVVTWRRAWPSWVIDMSCLCFAAVICAACMALRLYFPAYGAQVDLRPLYLWIPVIYVFAFTLVGRRSGLVISLSIMGLLVAISLPFLLRKPMHPDANFTIQMEVVSAILIAALHFFSSYQHRLQLTELTVDQLASVANTDDLTRLPNRRRLNEILGYELARFVRYGRGFSLILLDVDHFKSVNDRLGHAAGDQALVALSVRVGEGLRDGDTLGRWGGEEFVIVLPEADMDDALRKAHGLCLHVAAKPLIHDHTITISCGVTEVHLGDSADTLLRRADAALYAAKQRGRNRAEAASPRKADGAPMAPA